MLFSDTSHEYLPGNILQVHCTRNRQTPKKQEGKITKHCAENDSQIVQLKTTKSSFTKGVAEKRKCWNSFTISNG